MAYSIAILISILYILTCLAMAKMVIAYRIEYKV